ncbi:hypothetical protein BH18GEM1_BH18GEM1_04770 [soil metagenome]
MPRIQHDHHGLARRARLLVFFLAAVPAPLAAQREAPGALIAAARAVSGEVAAIRELPWLGAVDFRVSDRATIQRYARAALDREMSPEEWGAYETLLRHCGLIPARLDLRDLAVRLYTEQVAGYYDPQAKTFYLADWLPRLLQRAVVAHEATHALQDQHFDLARWLEAVPPSEDVALARAAVVEGDAMTAMLAYLVVPAGGSLADLPDIGRLLEGGSAKAAQGFPTFERAPAALQRLLLFPYVEGSAFVLAAFREGGWEAVDLLYREPPQSTEQILHPERYWGARDAPRGPATPEGTGRAPLLIEGSWGELGTQLVLAGALGDSAAAVAARGWDGDRYALYGSPSNPPAYAWTLLWDSPRAAARFAAAYAQATAARFPGSTRVVTGRGRFRFENPARTLELTWAGDTVEIRENFAPSDRLD